MRAVGLNLVLHSARSRRSPRYVTGCFVAIGVLFVLLAVLALTSNSDERTVLTVLSAVMAVASFAFVPFVARVIRWEDSGGQRWDQGSGGGTAGPGGSRG